KSRKRLRSKVSNSSGETVILGSSRGLTVILKPKDATKPITKLNPLKLKDTFEGTAPDGVIMVRPNHRLNVLALDTRNIESTKALLKLTSLGGIAVYAYEPRPQDSVIGILRDVDKAVTELELETALRAKVPVISVRRLGSSEVVKVVFGTTPPEYVTVGYTRFKVYPYFENPLQCSKCHRFGHVKGVCEESPCCTRCAGQHDPTHCEAETKCKNCRKTHEATSRQGPVYITEKAVLHNRRENNVDYMTAKAAIASTPLASTSQSSHPNAHIREAPN
ncbi:unnamed protein product, partial [Ixodes hexagonus]